MARRSGRARRALVGGALVAVVAGGATAVAAAGGLTLTPSSGPPGTAYEVQVECGVTPSIRQANRQGGPWQGTIAPYPADQVSMVSPSVWAVSATAGDWDAAWGATCEDAAAGDGVFDVDNPQLWFGPRGTPEDPRAPLGRTQVDGTDCPAGTTASGTILFEGDILLPFQDVAIDEHGDWSTPLPAAVGDAPMVIDASCGSVTYDQVVLTTTSTSTPTTVPPAPTTVPGPRVDDDPAPAVPRQGNAGYTG